METPQATASAVGEGKISYEGAWTVTDARGPVFDVIVFKNGQAVTNWVKGPAGARGERGYWRSDQQRLMIVYTNGCTEIIQAAEGKFSYWRYEAGAALDATPIVHAEARRLENSQLALIGVWRLNQEPDGSHPTSLFNQTARVFHPSMEPRAENGRRTKAALSANGPTAGSIKLNVAPVAGKNAHGSGRSPAPLPISRRLLE
jgi:hypothetical protein